ncbi:glutamic acid-rich protein-like [Lytechinus pictus]|uniref:glutamic acid-rich protein-like n=1 Tax=Lytechinus pictus TaxID=7653 RepID=UPI0030BA22E9
MSYLYCHICKKSIKGYKYQQHMQEHEATMTLRCTYCSYETEGRSEMTRHFGRMHNSRKQEAKYINYTAATTGHLRKREGERRDKWEEEKKTERESKERKEDKDDRKERKREGMDRKEKKKDEMSYLYCHICKKSIKGYKYQQHMQEHEATMTLRCTYCSYETEGRSEMTRHFGRMHNSRKQEAKYINYTAATTGHLRKREGERRDKWEEEKKTERESKERKEDKDDRKERKHEGEDRKERKHGEDRKEKKKEMPYLYCHICKKSIKGYKYQQHMQEHEATMTLGCTYCSYETEGRSEMTRHFGRMHNSRKQEAKYINYTAATTGHLRKREGERRDKWEEEKKTERESKERKEDKDDRKERKHEGEEDRKEKKKDEVQEDRKKERNGLFRATSR